MKKLRLFVFAGALAAAVPAMEGSTTLCASIATPGGNVGTTYATGVTSLSLANATCGFDNATTISVSNDSSQQNVIRWHSDLPGFPADLTVADITGLDAPVSFSADVPDDQPFFIILVDSTVDHLASNDGDELGLFEDQSGNVAGNDMAVNSSTLFDIYDYNLGTFLAGSPGHGETLSYWEGSDAQGGVELGGDPLEGIDIGIGADGSCGVTPCTETLTVNDLVINSTPEPDSMPLLGLGLSGLAVLLYRKTRHARTA